MPWITGLIIITILILIPQRNYSKKKKEFFLKESKELQEMKDCLFCYPELEPTQNIIMGNEFCMFLQLDQAKQEGIQLEGAGSLLYQIYILQAMCLL